MLSSRRDTDRSLFRQQTCGGVLHKLSPAAGVMTCVGEATPPEQYPSCTIERSRCETTSRGATRRNTPMKTLHIGALAALLAASAAPCAFAQTPTPAPDPSAASSPHQRDVTGSKAPASAATNGSAPGDASSAHQREAAHASIRNVS